MLTLSRSGLLIFGGLHLLSAAAMLAAIIVFLLCLPWWLQVLIIVPSVIFKPRIIADTLHLTAGFLKIGIKMSLAGFFYAPEEQEDSRLSEIP